MAGPKNVSYVKQPAERFLFLLALLLLLLWLLFTSSCSFLNLTYSYTIAEYFVIVVGLFFSSVSVEGNNLL